MNIQHNEVYMFNSKALIQFSFSLILMSLSISSISASVEDFPGRALYESVPVIQLTELHNKLNDVIIVDVRSAYEFKTLRVMGAVNIPLAESDFISQMQALRKKSDKSIVVYCNGKTCMKSYKAARKCQVENVKNVVAYDAGIFDWAKQYPKQTLLLGETLRDTKALISKEEFNAHLISSDAFSDRVANTEDIILDVRDRFQREAISIFIGREHQVYLDNTKRLDKYIEIAKNNNKALLIYDAAGKQVQWLQYYLKNKGVKEYYFMKGGIHAYFEKMREEELADSKK